MQRGDEKTRRNAAPAAATQGPAAPRIRAGAPADLPDLVRLYNHYVETTPITFDLEPYRLEQRRAWFDAFAASGPHRLLVAEIDGRSVGYASSGTFRAKAAYAQTVETSIYLDTAFTGRGIGTRLYEALLADLGAEPGAHLACAGITLPNPASIALHERFGFRPVGTLHEVGFKFGRYWDVAWYERSLAR